VVVDLDAAVAVTVGLVPRLPAEALAAHLRGEPAPVFPCPSGWLVDDRAAPATVAAMEAAGWQRGPLLEVAPGRHCPIIIPPTTEDPQ
jgi:hypothetical protein